MEFLLWRIHKSRLPAKKNAKKNHKNAIPTDANYRGKDSKKIQFTIIFPSINYCQEERTNTLEKEGNRREKEQERDGQLSLRFPGAKG